MDICQEMPHNSAGNSLMLFCLGAAVGATVMLLCAPASGREVRSQIAEKATQFKDKAVDLTEQAVDKAVEWKDKAKLTTHDTLTRAAEAFNGANASVPAIAIDQNVKV